MHLASAQTTEEMMIDHSRVWSWGGAVLLVASLVTLWVWPKFVGVDIHPIFGWAEAETWDKVSIFLVVLIPSALITFYTVYKARRLAAFLDALADERLGWGAKFKTLSQVWKKGP